MKLVHFLLIARVALTALAISQAHVAGSTLLDVSVAELRDVTLGWSAKREILGQPVYNSLDERIGTVDDVIVTSGKAVTYAISE